MKKQFKYLSCVFFLFSVIFFGQFVTAHAREVRYEPPGPEPTPVCEHNANSTEDGDEFYFSEDGECLLAPVASSLDDGDVPTAIKLISTSTEISDPVSTAGILLTFFILIALTIFWLTTIRKWNRHAYS